MSVEKRAFKKSAVGGAGEWQWGGAGRRRKNKGEEKMGGGRHTVSAGGIPKEKKYKIKCANSSRVQHT
jgi:hypothetical protein